MNDLDKISHAVIGPRSVLFCCVALLALAGHAFASPDVYQANVPQADHSDASLTAAFQNAMRIVLVRVTGRRSAASDADLAPLVQGARRYMQQYRSVGANEISVTFDSAAIDRWLSQNGSPLWGRERPVTVVWLAVPDAKGGASLVNRDDASALKHSLDLTASARGIELRWPTAAEAQVSGVTAESLGADAGTLVEASRKLGGEGALGGRASSASADATVRWVFAFQGHNAEFSGGFESLNRIADTYASIFAASGGNAPVEFEVAGLMDLRGYANAENYLESLTSISHLTVISFEGDTARFRAQARGGSDSLRHAVTLDGRLESVSGGSGAGSDLRFRLLR